MSIELKIGTREQIFTSRVRSSCGSSLPISPEKSAGELGFAGLVPNSIDAVSDRDFAAEALFIMALVGVHLSKVGEEWTIWCSSEFGWAELSDAYSTGSSIMPQKKNPDVAELARGKAGPLIGNLTSLLATMKGLHSHITEIFKKINRSFSTR